MTAPDPERTPTFTAFGDADDHLRLTVLIAGVLKHFEPDAAAVCRQAEKNPWSQRLAALQRLLRAADTGAAPLERPLVRVRDAEALPSSLSAAARWDDDALIFERSTFRIALESHPSVVALEGADATAPGASVYDQYEPALRPIARHIVARGWVDAHSLEAYQRLRRPQHVLVVAWDWLRPATRDTATRLSALRPAQQLNGGFGALALRDAVEHRIDEPTLATLDRGAIDELLDAGFLQRLPERPKFVRFPPRVREFLRAHASVFPAESLRADHMFLALVLPAKGDESEIERHHHAVRAEDEALALSTARFYGADLRALATSASHERRYADAVRIFRTMLEEFDPQDTYAWEYLGYNLWWPYQKTPSRMPQAVRDEARDAFERACTVDAWGRNNPFFRGSLLAFRAALGEDILADFDRWMQHFMERFRDSPVQALSFVDPIRGSLWAAGSEHTNVELSERWSRLGWLYEMRSRYATMTDTSDG